MDKAETKNIYTTLDTLLDTRLPTLSKISENIASKVIQNNNYHVRVRDNFDLVSEDIFTPIYRNRNKGILNYATPTKIFDVVKEFILAELSDLKTNETIDDMTLYVNTYPYQLNREEQNNIKISIHSYLPKLTITLINESYNEMRIGWMASNIKSIVMYDGLNWLEYFTANHKLTENPMINVSLIVPALITGRYQGKLKDIIKITEKQSSLLIDLHFVPVEYFNTLLKIKK